MKDTWLNKILAKPHRMFTEDSGRFYEIVYHKGYFFWQDKINPKTLLHNILINHWEVNEIMGISSIDEITREKKTYSTLNCMGYGHGIINGLFVRRKIKKQLLLTANVWSRVTSK